MSPNLLNMAEHLRMLKPVVGGAQSSKRWRRNKREIKVALEEGGGYFTSCGPNTHSLFNWTWNFYFFLSSALGEELAQLESRLGHLSWGIFWLGFAAAKKHRSYQTCTQQVWAPVHLSRQTEGRNTASWGGSRGERAARQNGLLAVKLYRSCCLLTPLPWQDVSLSTLTPNTWTQIKLALWKVFK